MTTTQALATTRDMSLAEIGRRIQLNVKSGWGLEKGSPPQLNIVALLCQKYSLLPGDDITLYDGKPWITIDGRVKLMRRHSEYRGYSTRPLTKDEKEAWGYEPDDIVVEATIRTTTWGDISARGKVSGAEQAGASDQRQRLNYVARIHPVEMAEKRAIARAERMAFGADSVIDEDQAEEEARMYVEERRAPEVVAAGAATYERIYGSDENGTAFADMPIQAPTAAEKVATRDPDTGEVLDDTPIPSPADARAALWAENRRLVAEAQARGIQGKTLNSRTGEDVLVAANTELAERIRNFDLDQQAAKESN